MSKGKPFGWKKVVVITLPWLLLFGIYAISHVEHASDNRGPGSLAAVSGTWPCGSTVDAYSQMLKWAARGDSDEMRRVMVRTGSILVVDGMQVKVLDVGFGKRQIRVLAYETTEEAKLRDERAHYSRNPRIGCGDCLVRSVDPGSLPPDPRIDRECWVAKEALQSPSPLRR